MRMLAAAGLVLALTAAACAAEAADTTTAGADRTARIDALFADLHAAKTETDGKTLEGKIVSEWLKSGDPEIDTLMLKAIVAMDTGALNQAFGFLDQIIDKDPGYAEGWNKRATVYYMIDDYEKSLADIQKTLELEPRHFGALSGLGMIMIKIGDKQRALQAFERAYEVDPVISNGKEVIEQLKAALGKDL
ncbi:MAG TPA: hypothetical protein VHA70_03390 [Bauldia sp.]|nr:hypothetical protein [Bauldia sp.]